jgi:uncharacterized protein (DUF302 family)
MTYGMSLTLTRPFDDAVTAVRDALAQHGFGIVSEIDMQQTLRTKLGVEIGHNLILGACNPGFAYRALQAEPSIGLLLPCNVVVRGTEDGTVVEMIDPQIMVALAENPEMELVAGEVAEKLSAALESLRTPSY